MHITVLLDHPQAFRSLRSAFRRGPGSPVNAQLRFLPTWTELHDTVASDRCYLARLSGMTRVAFFLYSEDAASLGLLSQRVANRPLGEFVGTEATEDPFTVVADKLGA